MSASQRRLKDQQRQDEMRERAVDHALHLALNDQELWPLLQWLYYAEARFPHPSFGPNMEFREGQRSIGFALQERANRVDWERWQQCRALYEKPRPKPEAVSEEDEA